MVNVNTNRRALLSFIFVLAIFLLLADLLVISEQRNHAIKEFEKHSNHEIILLGQWISESLLRNDYANIERFIKNWGTSYPQIIKISVHTSGNNFILASYERQEPISAHTLSLTQTIPYGDEKHFTLGIIKDSTLIHDDIASLTSRLILSSLVFVIVMGIFMWRTLKITAIAPLQKEIKERMKTEEKLQNSTVKLRLARDQALQASRHKSEFLANMSHELRTPLNSIIGFTSIVKEGLAGPVNDEQKKQLGLVFSSSEHLLGLINSILDLAKIEAGKYETDKSEFDFKSLLEELADSLRPQADEKSLDLIIKANCKDGKVYTDRNMLLQILLNLAGNAIKFTEKGSITLECDKKDDDLVIRVIDTGIGISHTHLEEIFEAFKQVDASTTRKYDGTGLGLSISQHFALILGGQIKAESEEGAGTIFTLTLPAVI